MKRTPNKDTNRRTTASKPGHKNCGAATHSPDTTRRGRRDTPARPGDEDGDKSSEQGLRLGNVRRTRPTTRDGGRRNEERTG
jgi:hypothetical protein